MKKQIVCMALAIALTGSLYACGNTQSQTPTPQSPGTSRELLAVSEPKAIGYDDYAARDALRTANPVTEGITDSLENFALRTSAQLLNARENGCYSPISLYYALALCASGAKGETQQQMLSLLGTEDTDTLMQQCSNLYQQLYFNNNYGRLRLATSVWADDSLPIKEDYVKAAANRFFASLYQVDFANGSTGGEISQWVSRQTNGLLAPESTIDPETLLTLINTIYFKDEWQNSFMESETKSGTFHPTQGADVTADYMHRSTFGGFVKGEKFIRASLYTKNDAEMIFVLPQEGTSIYDLLSTPEQLGTLLSGGEEESGEVRWTVPKFSINSRYELGDTLQSLGITDAFMPSADFTGISEQPLMISSVVQGTYIAIDENGVEAAAYTEIGMCGSALPEETVEMNLNRPFLYAIRERGVLLFVGICENPAA